MRGYAYTETSPCQSDNYTGWSDETCVIDTVLKYDFDEGAWLIINDDGERAYIVLEDGEWVEVG